KLNVTATLKVGNEPRGVVLSKDRAYVVVSGDNAVDVVDLATKKVSARIAVGMEPWYAALTPDGRRLVVGNANSGDLSLVDTATLKQVETVSLGGRNLRRIAIDPKGEAAYVA